ncbi:putative cellulose-binding protein [Phaeoacremonium minimum UCRPA7]|uniref:Putative cellulose-binding protein n=1 Tax=Phaeoacremonium minimum (strain UCR-PA7) TaxID=1286976 RepID=R8BQZ0_PHAM7|nr:putative cellulose-binding protein [Phaeoacremonium minimum UCRPA7]EOO01710.1 putative cellulose-binding protein [Phaeoacremonium minimum UCRPA7]
MIEVPTAHAGLSIDYFYPGGPTLGDDAVDAWELKASRRALRNLRTLLAGQPMLNLIAKQIEEADEYYKSIIAESQGQYKESRIDLKVKGLTVGQFMTWQREWVEDLKTHEGKRGFYLNTMVPAHPEHYALPDYPIGIIETIGEHIARVRLHNDSTFPDFILEYADPSYSNVNALHMVNETQYTVILLLSLGVASSGATSDGQCQITPTDKRRLFVLTDIANEPDDAQSLVRLLVYSNEFDIQGIVATTSVWLNDTTRADQIYGILDAYEEVLPNLRKHADGYPEAAYLRGLVTSGLPVYGMDGVGSAKDSDGSKLLVSAVDASDEPTWVLVWGGSSVLAQALWHVNATRSSTEVEKFVSKLRAYAISDQDNTGIPNIRNGARGVADMGQSTMEKDILPIL